MDIKVKFGLLALLIVFIQSTLKLFGVLITSSLSFLSETIDTLTDIFFASLTIYALYQSKKPPDYEHMYGHSKIDSIGAMIQGIILINIYILLIYNAINTIITESYLVKNPNMGILLIIISFIINIIFSRYLMYQGKKRNSLTLKIQGLNLFQDSMRAILVILNFLLVLFFNLKFLDPYFSVILSIWIILSALKLSKEGIKDLIDVNPINVRILEDMKQEIFKIEHVNGVEDLRVRSSGKALFLEVHLSVEDHISIVHANEITKIIRAMGNNYFPSYDVEIIIEMNPLGGEPSLSEKILNLLHSMKSEFPNIVDFRDLNIFRIEHQYFLSLTVIVNDVLTLNEAHTTCHELENQLKEQTPLLSRIITHIESKPIVKKVKRDQIICTSIEPEKLNEVKNQIKQIFKSESLVKDFHGLDVWKALDSCILELHVLLDGNLNISKVHDIITDLEHKIRENLVIEDLTEIILHSEPIDD